MLFRGWPVMAHETHMRRCMTMSIMDLYSAEPWSISTALCVLSGNNEIGSFSAIVWSSCWWTPDCRDCPVASSRQSNQRQRRPDNRKCWAGNVVQSDDVEWQDRHNGRKSSRQLCSMFWWSWWWISSLRDHTLSPACGDDGVETACTAWTDEWVAVDAVWRHGTVQWRCTAWQVSGDVTHTPSGWATQLQHHSN